MEKIINKKELFCWDCKKQLKENDEVMPYNTSDGDFFKCKECHQKDSTLRNYKPTEIYSRCVGYIRPVGQWNPGKKAEFKDRKVFVP